MACAGPTSTSRSFGGLRSGWNGSGESPQRRLLLREVEAALDAGVAAVNLSTLEGLADELFTYAGSGTLFTRERYVTVRRLGLDDYDAATIWWPAASTRAILAPRSPDEVERVLASGFGAFVEGPHLAGIGALLEHAESAAAEIASLYTLTRFLGEGVGGHLIGFALDEARARGFAWVFAGTALGAGGGLLRALRLRRVARPIRCRRGSGAATTRAPQSGRSCATTS